MNKITFIFYDKINFYFLNLFINNQLVYCGILFSFLSSLFNK